MDRLNSLALDDDQGNCKQCGHPFDPHLITPNDPEDLTKGGQMRCPVEGCGCLHTVNLTSGS